MAPAPPTWATPCTPACRPRPDLCADLGRHLRPDAGYHLLLLDVRQLRRRPAPCGAQLRHQLRPHRRHPAGHRRHAYSATLNGTLNSYNNPVTYTFAYGTAPGQLTGTVTLAGQNGTGGALSTPITALPRARPTTSGPRRPTSIPETASATCSASPRRRPRRRRSPGIPSRRPSPPARRRRFTASASGMPTPTVQWQVEHRRRLQRHPRGDIGHLQLHRRARPERRSCSRPCSPTRPARRRRPRPA